MKRILFTFVLFCIAASGNAQVGIGTNMPHPSSELHIQSADKGVLIPQLALDSSTDESTISNGNVESLLVYNTNTTTDLSPGYYFWHNGRWNRIIADSDLPPQAVTSLIDNGDGTYTYSNEDGEESLIDIPANQTLTHLEYNAAESSLIYTDEDRNSVIIDLHDLINAEESLTSLRDNADGTLTYVDETGASTLISLAAIIDEYESVTGITANAGTGSITYTDEAGGEKVLNITEIIKAQETLSSLKDNGDGSFIYTDEDGISTSFNANTLVIEDESGNYSFLDSAGNVLAVISTNADALNYDNTTTGLAAGNVQEALDEVQANVVAAEGELEALNLVDNGDGTVSLVKADGSKATISKSAVTDNTDGTYTFTNQDGTDVTIDANQIEIMDNGDGSFTISDGTGTALATIGTAAITNIYDPTASGLAATNVQLALDEIQANVVAAEGELEALNLVDNGDGTVSLVKADGSTATISKSAVTDNTDGTYTFTNQDGTDVTIDANQIEIVDNGDGSFTISDGTGTALATIETAAITNIYDNTTSGLTATNVQSALDEVQANVVAAEGNLEVLNLVDNEDGTVSLVKADGSTATISKSAVTDNTDGTYTFTNQDGTDVTIDGNQIEIVDNGDGSFTISDGTGTALATIETAAVTNIYDPTASGLVAVNVQAALDEIQANVVAAEGELEALNLVDNGDGTVSLLKADGSKATISKSAVTDNTDGTYTFTNQDGTDVTIDGNQIEIVDNGDGSFTISDGTGTALATIETAAITNIYDPTASGLVAVNVQEALDEVQANVVAAEGELEALNLVDNGDGTVSLVKADGSKATISKSAVTDNTDGTYTFTNQDGTDVTIDANQIEIVDNGDGSFTISDGTGTALATIETAAATNIYDPTVSGLMAVNVQSALDEIQANVVAAEGELEALNLVDNGDGTVSLVKADGSKATISKSAVTDNTDGTYTFTNQDGTDVTIDANQIEIVDNGDGSFTISDGTGTALATIKTAANTNIYDPTVSGLAATNVQLALDEIQANVVAAEGNLEALNLVDNGDGTVSLVKADGSKATISKSAVTDNTDGTYTFTNQDGTDVTIDGNTLSITESDGVYTFTDGAGTALMNIDVVEVIQNNQSELDLEDIGGTLEIGQINNGLANQVLTTNARGNGLSWIDPTALAQGGITSTDLIVTDGDLSTFKEVTLEIAAEAVGAVEIAEDAVGTTELATNAVATENILDGNVTAKKIAADVAGAGLVQNASGALEVNTSEMTDLIKAEETLTILVENTDGTFSYTDEEGNSTILDVANLETLTSIALNPDNINIDYTDEDGTVTQMDLTAVVDNLETVTTLVENTNGTFTFTNEDGTANILDVTEMETLTKIALNPDNINIDYTDEDGTVTQMDLTAVVDNLETVTTLVENTDGTFTFTNEDGTANILDVANLETLTSIALNPDNINIDYTDEDGIVTQMDLTPIIDNLETVTTLVENTDGTFTFTNEDGTANILDVTEMETLTKIALNPDNINIDYTDEEGIVTQMDLTAVIDNLETVSRLEDKGDGTFTYMNEDDDLMTFDANTLTVSEADGVYSFTRVDGSIATINTNASGITYDFSVVAPGQSVSVQSAIDLLLQEIASLSDPLKSGTTGQVLSTDINEEMKWVDLPELAQGGITSSDLTVTEGSLSTFKNVKLEIAEGAVEAAEIKDGAVGTAEIATDAVTADELAENAVGNSELADDAVQTGNILDGTIAAVDVATAAPGAVLTTDSEGTPGWVTQAEMLEGSQKTSSVEGSGNVTVVSETDALNTTYTIEVEAPTLEENSDGTLTYTTGAGTTTIGAVMPKFFYMPAVIFDTSVQGSGMTRNLHQEYMDQFQSPVVSSAGAEDFIPTLGANELEYHITYYDTTVLSNLSIDAKGVLTYDVIDNATPASFMNIVFVVKTPGTVE